MKSFLKVCFSTLCFSLLLVATAFAQNSSKSLLINHGGTSCSSTSPQQHFFAGTLTANPTLLSTCNIGIPYFDVMASYNPADHKIYFAKKSSGITEIFALDFNLGGAINCPTGITPTYTYNYGLDQLTFDNNGNNYVIYNYNLSAGTAYIKSINIATGSEIPGTNKMIQFPAGNLPNTVLSGDVVCLPNGRIFMTFGDAPSKLYELTNITGTGNATAVFLTNLPRVCYSIGYVDGAVTVAGSDANGCYYYIWDINSFSLSTANTFPLSKNSADMTNLTVAVGCSKELLGANFISSNTADLAYQITIKNKGNIFLNNIQLVENLANVFGAANVSNVQVTFIQNPGNLLLNPSYNGTTNVNLLAPNQVLSNYPVQTDSAVIRVTLRASNLVAGQLYKNSAVASGDIGAGANYMAVSDSSNNGDHNQIDVDKNGVSDDAGENTPTPFIFGNVLPDSKINLQGIKTSQNIKLSWKALDDQDITSYELQKSTDGRSFISISSFSAIQSLYTYTDADPAGINYYRVKINKRTDLLYSNTLLIKTSSGPSLSVFPNPFSYKTTIQVNSDQRTKAIIYLRDISNKVVVDKIIDLDKGMNYYDLEDLSKLNTGVYFMEVRTSTTREYVKLIKR